MIVSVSIKLLTEQVYMKVKINLFDSIIQAKI